jgi:sugar phosphate isomerase/epimerase
VEAFNVLLPWDLKVTGDSVDPERQVRYLRSGFARAAALGGKVAVFGSGGARQVPEGFSRDTAYRQIREFLLRAGDAAAAAGIDIAVEPLNITECNILNSVAEAVRVVDQANHPAVHVLSDLYHVDHDSQSFDETANAGARLRHVHIASCPARGNPTTADSALLTDYFRAARKAGYDGRISIEGSWENLERDAASSLAAVRAAWDASAA